MLEITGCGLGLGVLESGECKGRPSVVTEGRGRGVDEFTLVFDCATA